MLTFPAGVGFSIESFNIEINYQTLIKDIFLQWVNLSEQKSLTRMCDMMSQAIAALNHNWAFDLPLDPNRI